MISQTETARRLVDLARHPDTDLATLVDFDVLQIHRPEVDESVASKRQFFLDHAARGKVEIARVLLDGMHVALHFRVVSGSGNTISFHVYRFDAAGKVIALWANTQQELPARPDGTTMLNGAVPIDHRTPTEQTRARTDAFFKVQIEGPPEAMASFFANGKMIQHNMRMDHDIAGFGVFLQTMAAAGRAETIHSYELCVCEGDFSLTATRASLGPDAMVFFDLQRWENGNVAEHWDVLAPLAPAAQWKNRWGAFSFFPASKASS